jgi:ankyrin repeat protein
MKDPSRLARIAHEAGASNSSHIQRLRTLQPLEPRPQWASPADAAAAREILVQQRTQNEAWKDPTKQKRRFLRTKSKNESLANPENWAFSRAERSVALDDWIRQLGAVGVAQALLDFGEPLDVNLIETESRDKASSELEVPQENDWLEYVACTGSVEHVVLLASYPTRQSAKDRALSVALSGRRMSVVKELLRYGANPNNGLCDAYFFPAVVEGDLELVELFLSASNPLTDAAISTGLVKAVETCNSHMVSLMLAHGADACHDEGKALESAVLKNRFQDLALICWKTQRPLSSAGFSKAISTSCTVQDKFVRNSTLNLLLCAGADPNHPALEDLLLQAARIGSTSTVSLLIAHGTSPNRRDGEPLQIVVQSRRIDLVEIILQSTSVSSNSTSKALQQIPEEASDSEFHELATCLINKGVAEEALNACLARVVGTQRLNFFAPTLVKQGACLDYDDAASVRFALREQNLTLLETLLIAPCAAYNLAKAIPDAMAISSGLVRRNTMDLLLRKGVSGPELHRALRTAVGEADGRRVDYELAELLIRYKASVDFVGSNGNCLYIAAQRRDLKAIELLCRGQPSSDTTSAALPLVLTGSGSSSDFDHADTYKILSVLLRHGACGEPLAQALIDSVQQGCDARTISLLLDKGADVNYKDGKAAEYTLCASDIITLKLICESERLEQGSLERLVPQALEPLLFNIDKAECLLRCCVKHRGILDSTLLLEVASMGRRREVIQLLLELGASVDHMEAAALGNTVSDGDIDTTKMLLLKNPARNHLQALLKVVSKIDSTKRQRLSMMQLLLSHGGPGIGQDDVLVQEIELVTTREDDLSCIKLLLDNGASVDYQQGVPIQAALDRNQIPIFDLFISQRPAKVSLANAFSSGRRNTAFTVQERWHVFDSLFRAGMGGNNSDTESASLALIEAVERDPSDTTIPTLLVKNGASAEYEQGRALQSAVLSASAALVELFLCQQEQRPNINLINRAFGSMISSRSIDLPGGFKTAQLLLEHGVQKSLIDNAMSKAFSTTTGYTSKKEVGLFLSHGADVNSGSGTYFVHAVQKEDMELFHTLVASGQPDISVIISALIQSMAPEKVLVRYLRVLLASKPSNVPIDSSALFMAIKRFPRGEELVRLLFEYGCVSNSTTVATISPVMGSENINIVIWALLRGNPKVSDEVIVAILQAGNEGKFSGPDVIYGSSLGLIVYSRSVIYDSQNATICRNSRSPKPTPHGSDRIGRSKSRRFLS